MKATGNEIQDLARLLPEPVDQELPADRQRRLQEFVMSQIQREKPVHRPRRRPMVLIASATTAAVAVVAGIAVVAFGPAGPGAPGPTKSRPPAVAAAPMSGPQVLFAAATTAEKEPASSGTYWHVKVVSTGGDGNPPSQYETWTTSDGRGWLRGEKTKGQVRRSDPVVPSAPFRVGPLDLTLARLEKLPTTPERLRAWIADAVRKSDVRTSAGRPDAKMRERMVFDGLVSLISDQPAPPKVRAAAFRAIAAHPNVRALGPVNGGQGLSVTFDGQPPVKLVVDPATGRVRGTNFAVTGGAQTYSPSGTFTIYAEWTDVLPR